ncbi:MAG: hypothetical protein AMXMBFR84_17380 [Candidatus Hydrogenedentota bacterium]
MATVLKAGTAKRDITPKQGYHGTQVFGMASEGIAHPISARVLVLTDGDSRFVIASYDLNCLDVATPILRERCETELGIKPSHLALLATHNHNAPIQIAHDNFGYGRWLADSLFDSIQEAIADAQGPVTLSYGVGDFPWIRCVGNCGLDTEVQVLRVSKGGDLVAVVFNHPVHPLLGASHVIEPGHPGYACETLEEQFPGCVALYADACGGNQFPVEITPGGTPTEKAIEYANGLAGEVSNVLYGPMIDVTGPMESRFEIISLPLGDPLPRAEVAKLMQTLAKGPLRVPYPHPDRGNNWIRVLNDYYETGKSFPKRLDELVCTDDGFMVDDIGDGRKYPCRYEEALIAKIGGLAFVCLQGEVVAPIGMRIKDAFRVYHPIMVNAYFGEHNLYIPSRELVRQDSYQAGTLRTQYASPVGWSEDVEDVMADTVIRHIREMWPGLPVEEFDHPHLAVRQK